MPVTEGQDRVTISLGHRVTVAAVLQSAVTIGVDDSFIGVLMICSEPAQQCRPKVEADVRVVVYYSPLACRWIIDGRKSIRSIALGVYALVPIMKGRGARFRFDNSSPRIL